MPKVRTKKRKLPIVPEAASKSDPSTAAQSCRNTIRKYHVLMKRRKQLEQAPLEHKHELAEIDRQVSELGGLERYQQLSSLGQQEQRGGGSEKIFVNWLKELNLHRRSGTTGKLRLLEVGALKPDNYQPHSSWIEWTPIDLRSRHPSIAEQDFLLLDLKENQSKWDAISLSLVLNFVPVAADRGLMLQLAYNFLLPDGLLFLALPLPCVANSRYLTFDHLKALMESIGFTEVRERWRKNGKMGYWLYQKKHPTPLPSQASQAFAKKTVLRTGNRNNFVIILDPSTRTSRSSINPP
ncbi:25S rRNA (adenine(2142)-N(1))-methyltransferase [Psilocybe cubensis]|uniref:25S rRNA (Adenine(2142)-N(1))-methyltransferase n=2 Tax=Psilocybe cubensis TaxID=181762 RepID=A0ACB8H901_PSICU|nr:25S rRNA (adenine(2142)-N(1))-methyltransferase [Psilocybe cubensis]KAH9484184.1 25S rRNA (adenine(2142)-N(1))-methyltransferase [Psilocybe cubensis]